MFAFSLLPRFSETDGLGHISNTCLPAWFEEARKELFKLFNPTLSLKTWNLILKKYEIDILQQISYENEILIQTSVANIGNKSLTVLQEAFQSQKPVANAKTVLVYFNYQKNLTEEIPAEIKSQLLNHLMPKKSNSLNI